jgi:hypothetical protein
MRMFSPIRPEKRMQISRSQSKTTDLYKVPCSLPIATHATCPTRSTYAGLPKPLGPTRFHFLFSRAPITAFRTKQLISTLATAPCL